MTVSSDPHLPHMKNREVQSISASIPRGPSLSLLYLNMGIVAIIQRCIFNGDILGVQEVNDIASVFIPVFSSRSGSGLFGADPYAAFDRNVMHRIVSLNLRIVASFIRLAQHRAARHILHNRRAGRVNCRIARHSDHSRNMIGMARLKLYGLSAVSDSRFNCRPVSRRRLWRHRLWRNHHHILTG